MPFPYEILRTDSSTSMQCPTAKYPSLPGVPKRRISLYCPTAEYPQSVPGVCNCRVVLQCCNARPRAEPGVSQQCPTAEYPYGARHAKFPSSAQPENVPALPSHRVSPKCPKVLPIPERNNEQFESRASHPITPMAQTAVLGTNSTVVMSAGWPNVSGLYG